MIPVDEAKRILLSRTPVLDTVRVGLAECLGRVIAADVAADRDYPPTDRSAMDGYAVRAADLTTPASLPMVGEIRAGQAVGGVRVEPGTAVRILTGAIVPPGADSVVMVERTEQDSPGGPVRFLQPAVAGANIRCRGEDVRAGEIVVAADTRLRPADVAAMATVGAVEAAVRRRPRINVVSTGDELVDPTASPADHQVRNSNARALLALAAEMGIPARHRGVAVDSADALDRTLEEGLDGDLLLITGGVSVGRYDLVADRLVKLGTETLFHKIAMRPGKPVLAGVRGRCMVIGLPGNPVSAFTGFHVLAVPVLRKMLGLRRHEPPTVVATLADDYTPRPGRRTYRLAAVRIDGDGGPTVEPTPTASSGDVLSLPRANAYIVTEPETGPLRRGERVLVLPWSSLLTD